MTLSDLLPVFQGHNIFDLKYPKTLCLRDEVTIAH